MKKVISDTQLSFFEKEKKESEVTQEVVWRMYVDGASRGNPGLASCGVVLYKKDVPTYKEGFFLGTMTNNQAEYMGLLAGLFVVKTMMQPRDILLIFSDSQLLVCQMQGLYKVRNSDLLRLHQKARLLLTGLTYSFEHVLREYNQEADAMANEAFITKKRLPQPFISMMKDDQNNTFFMD